MVAPLARGGHDDGVSCSLSPTSEQASHRTTYGKRTSHSYDSVKANRPPSLDAPIPQTRLFSRRGRRSRSNRRNTVETLHGRPAAPPLPPPPTPGPPPPP